MAYIFQEQAMHCVRCAAVVLMSNAGEWLLTEQMDESQVTISEILGLNPTTELNFKNFVIHVRVHTLCEYKISSQR